MGGPLGQANRLVWEIAGLYKKVAENYLSKFCITKSPQVCFDSTLRLSRRDNLRQLKEKRMHLARRVGLTSLALTAVFVLTACPSTTTISQINADPGRFRNKEVAIAGRVTDSYGVLGNGAYEIDDGTGRLWVVTRRGVPSRGSQVGSKGRVYNGFSFGGRSFGTVLEETDRRAKGK